MILNAFKSEMSGIVAEQYVTVTGGYDPITGQNKGSTSSWVSAGNCLFWTGSQAERVVASKIRDVIDAVAVFYTTVSITGEKLRINGGNVYEIIGKPDDVALNGEALVVALKEVT